jgi:hypothetical protein
VQVRSQFLQQLRRWHAGATSMQPCLEAHGWLQVLLLLLLLLPSS